MSDEGKAYLSKHGIDISLNSSVLPGIIPKNVLFELNQVFVDSEYNHLKLMKNSGANIIYRPSFRDTKNGSFKKYSHLIDYYIDESRRPPDNEMIYSNLSLDLIPFYRCTIIQAIWWAVASGCKRINLFGIQLEHGVLGGFPTSWHPTLIIHSNENAFSLIYKLWVFLLSKNIEIAVDPASSLCNPLRKFDADI